MEGPVSRISTGSITSKFQGNEDNRTDGWETESPCTSSRVDECFANGPRAQDNRPDGGETETPISSAGESEKVQVDGDDVPKSKMEFNFLEDLMSYYKEYGKKYGFGVMTKRSERGEDETVRYVTLACARGGKAQNRILNVSNPRPTGKTECKAKINASKTPDGKFQLNSVHNIHNHNLSPKKSRFFRCNREVSESVKRVLDTNDMAGIRMNKSFGSLVVGTGGFENLPFLENDCRNYIDKARHLRLGAGGAGALRDYFLRMQYKNLGFFALMDLDDDGRLKNIFWADPRSRAAYQYFDDVVTFDTTYLMNRYGMPFAPFVGVNHHGQSILLGAGLIFSEDTETFVWLFQTWLQCMDSIAPKAIITDQDSAMKNAISIVFPESRHRFCLWHILRKVHEKLGSYASYKTGMKTALMRCVYDSQSREDFEKCWDQFITMYNLHENAWLQSLYTEREYWTNLKEFVDQYDNALKKKIKNENVADFHSFNVTIPCISRSPIEKRYQDLYTNGKFREVQQQLARVIDLDPVLLKVDGTIKTYGVEDEVCLEEFTKLVTHSVVFSSEDTAAKCSCGLFEMRGIVCRHIFAVFKCNGIKSLPDTCILDRWRKDIKRRYMLIHSSYDTVQQWEDSIAYSSLLNICYKMITHTAGSREHTLDATNKLHAMIELYSGNQDPPCCPNVDGTINVSATIGSSKQVLSPHVVRGKGRPPSLRRASRMERDLRKVKEKTKRAQGKGKRKQRDGEDTPVVDVCKNLFGFEQAVRESIPAPYITEAQPQETFVQSQESMLVGLDGSQPLPAVLDGSQPAKMQ
ncbi:protein FAR1-RELATED SEQUENCE 5-like [Carya illinoinensis]|uniref:protein FAR1-RELATED SEQUENCE 5-like n=1 Tax=Carya illinoinensis TaxID=32201 RepID=UPI001C723D98|nr:protein FAR1-RELATED SEQUENCE 5-like [Carya illinoinensis]